MHLPADDWSMPGVIGEVLLDDVYGLRRRRDAYASIVDVGANVGIFTLAAGLTNRRAVIHAYEPNRRLEQFLAVQCAAVGAKFFLEAVAADCHGRDLAETEGTSVRTRTQPGTEVPSVTLPIVVERIGGTVDLLKLDCEGAEWELLENDEGWDAVAELAMEYHLFQNRKLGDLVALLQARGFEVTDVSETDALVGFVRARSTRT